MGARERCSRCGAGVLWRVGPQWSGWVAPELDGPLRDVCYRDADGAWRGHVPAEPYRIVAEDGGQRTEVDDHSDADPGL